jgi:HEAT repeat protein
VLPAPPAAPQPPAPPGWLPEAYMPDSDLRVEALGSLIRTDAHKVIPMLRAIVFESDNPGVARRALFVLAQSRDPMATATVVEVAKSGPQPVRVAAVRDLGFFGGPEISKELLQVYWAADLRIKQQVVISLGDRADAGALVTIAEGERDRGVRESAIIALGRVGGRGPLRELYWKVGGPLRQSIIIGLSSARDDEGLIRIANEEKDAQLRTEALSRLKLLGTPRAKTYLATVKK